MSERKEPYYYDRPGGTGTWATLGHVGRVDTDPPLQPAPLPQPAPEGVSGGESEARRLFDLVQANPETRLTATEFLGILSLPGVAHAHVLRGLIPLSRGELLHLLADIGERELPAAGPWVSVKDAMPLEGDDKGRLYQILTRDKRGNCYITAFHKPDPDDAGFWSEGGDEITHWARINPLKEGKGE